MLSPGRDHSVAEGHTAHLTIPESLRRLDGFKGVRLNTRIKELATRVGMPLSLLDRFTHQLSGE